VGHHSNQDGSCARIAADLCRTPVNRGSWIVIRGSWFEPPAPNSYFQ
jgi:hypothetical protein